MRLEVVTPQGTLLAAEVDELTAPGEAGEFGVLPGHIPFLTGLRPGVLSWRGAQGTAAGVLAVGPGFAEVVSDRIVVLADMGALPKDIDVAAAKRDLAEAQQLLDRWQGEDPGAHAEAEAKRNWAQARIDAVGAGASATKH